MEAKDFGCLLADAMEDWALDIVDGMMTGSPQMLMAGVYVKNGIRNYRKKKETEIQEMIDNALLFIANDKGEVDADKVMSDLLSVIKDMDKTPFDWGIVSGSLGKGELRFDIPSNWFMRTIFGDNGSVVITEDDFKKLTKLLTSY
jgi:hypothetical protein